MTPTVFGERVQFITITVSDRPRIIANAYVPRWGRKRLPVVRAALILALADYALANPLRPDPATLEVTLYDPRFGFGYRDDDYMIHVTALLKGRRP